MSEQYDNNNRGVLFKNKRKENERQPDYTGSGNFNGADVWISAWIKEAHATGEKFFSISFREKDPMPNETDTQSQNSGYGPNDDDIPF